MTGTSDVGDVFQEWHELKCQKDKATKVLGLARRYTNFWGDNDYHAGIMMKDGFSRGSFLDALILRTNLIRMFLNAPPRTNSQDLDDVLNLIHNPFSVDAGVLYHPDGRIKLVKSPEEFRNVSRDTKATESGALILNPREGMTLDQTFDAYNGLIIDQKDIETVTTTSDTSRHVIRGFYRMDGIKPEPDFASNRYLSFLAGGLTDADASGAIMLRAYYDQARQFKFVSEEDDNKINDVMMLSLLLGYDLFSGLKEQDRKNSLLMCTVSFCAAFDEQVRSTENGVDSSYISCVDCSDGVFMKFPATLGVKYHGKELDSELHKILMIQ